MRLARTFVALSLVAAADEKAPRPAPAAAAARDAADSRDASEWATPEVDRAVARGLRWLALHQEPCGGWPGDSGHKQMNDYVVYQPAEYTRLQGGAQMGVSALAGLAYLADGQLPDHGLHAKPLDRLVEYVLAHQNEFGYLQDGGSRMYSHSFATLFLAEVYGMCPKRTKEIESALRRAVQFTQNAQNENGGWRYEPFTIESDLSVTVCQVQALRAARNVGIPVSASCIDRVVAYVRDSRRYDGAYWYKIHGRAARQTTSFAVSAAAITTLHSAGVYDPKEYAAALEDVAEGYDDVSRHWPEHFYFWYGNYYAAQALFIEGGPRWRRYWTRLRDDLLARQQEDGRWRNDVGPGDAFATAVACLLLRVPAQYLPIFQR
jgi:hypothetical protein